MHRRQFIQYTTAGLVTLSLPLSNLLGNPSPGKETIAYPDLLSLIQNKNEVLEVGKAYRRRFPEEDHKEILKKSLFAHSKAFPNLGQSIQSDYETGQILTIQGWVLSITEARQCALFSILN